MERPKRRKVVIWQQNINKSPTCQHTLISNNILVNRNISIIALQEPAINAFNYSIASKDWISVYPSTHNTHPDKTRTLTLIHSAIPTDSWEQIDFPSGDVTLVILKGDWGKLVIFNIYNDGRSNETIRKLIHFHSTCPDVMEHTAAGEPHILWLGDFNRHHPHWDDPNDTRLFTKEALKAAEYLIEAVATLGLDLALPSGLPTHLHNVTKKWTRLDQVFISDHSLDLIEGCETVPSFRCIKTDHLPIITKLSLTSTNSQPAVFRNFREVDWESFRGTLVSHLTELGQPKQLRNQEHLNTACETLTAAIQMTINTEVPKTNLCSKSKRWWTRELTQLRRHSNKLGRLAYKLRDDSQHPVHREHVEAAKLYDRTLERTKRQHWRDWLERAVDPDIWTVHKVISTPHADGGKARIPALKHKQGEAEKIASTNSEKSQALANCFFPTKPLNAGEPADYNYPAPCCRADRLTKDQITHQLRKLKPYKAPGPDGIPNAVLSKCADILVDRLYYIYKVMLE